ncbi:hypothetical protein BAUCODRAFT_149162 [Baudoinia panamericana UAMH 10762]|uniref:Xylanolytic transcriptional activator regulatory domain-containing protein n=1 Tax=Baudoinia panamericana (strain UAMH 10762) TaxID=717646 RepID=M2N8I4_BAUPA|nr:uncharacterized protein BAUCODRAFT_149162 [Baudoinia panamericana UAMH 10762]EMC95140.1 hypothetical protein BAUCODRAFT_149162 [Baudoinia panamericana UAMH 10762]
MLVRRLAQVEEQLESVKATNGPPAGMAGRQSRDGSNGEARQTSAHAGTAAIQTRSALQGQGTIWADGSAFVGETSAHYNLDQMEDRLDRLGVARPARASSPPTQPLTRPVTPERGAAGSRTDWRRNGDVRRLLHTYGISIDGEAWQSWLTSFFAEVHPLYPFLHPPSVWEEYNKMWEIYLATRSYAVLNDEEDMDLKLAQIFLALAIGRCTATRSMNDGRHSAGWSFYSVALDLVGDVLNLCGNRASPLLQLQTLCLMIVYLFRLDANERAQNVLALAVSHAHSLGINRNAILSKMPHFQEELLRRIWWCIYVLDRRLCLETGRPFLILDLNTDTETPSDLSDSWLSTQRFAKDTTSELNDMIAEELRRCSISSVSYLRAMIGYSRVTGKVWEAVYAIPVAGQPLNALQREYMELLLDRWKETLPSALVYQGTPGNNAGSAGPKAIVLQSFLLYLRYHYMKLMMRKPVLQPAINDLENSFTCMQLAHTIIDAFTHAPPTWGVLKFPFLPYFLGATMASLSVLVTEPTLRSSYAEPTLQAAKLLKQSCYASWVSRRTALTIARLHAIVNSILLTSRGPTASAESLVRGPMSRPSQPREQVEASQELRPSSSAAPGQSGGQISPISMQQDGSLTLKIKTPNRNSDSRVSTQAGVHQDCEPNTKPQAVRAAPSASDLNWADIDVGDFDFEQAISGGQLMNSKADHEMLLPWGSGTGSWLDRLLDVTPDMPVQQSTYLDPTILANPQGPSNFANWAGSTSRSSMDGYSR